MKNQKKNNQYINWAVDYYSKCLANRQQLSPGYYREGEFGIRSENLIFVKKIKEVEGKKICDEVLQSRDTVDQFVNTCCSIAISHQFDGWLLNIENKLDREQVPNMMYLVKKLTQETHNRDGPNTKVIWYDSVTHDGELNWQNALNEKNVEYFDSCDGIYLNYGWRIKPDVNDLDQTVEFLERHCGNVNR